MNDLKIPNNNISVCEPSVLCEPNVLCTKRTNPETNISQHILTQSHCQEQKSNLSESQILENQGQKKETQRIPKKKRGILTQPIINQSCARIPH